MIYLNFKINNYKGVNDITINLSNNRIITLVGLNESGKTSIMEGMHLYYKLIKGTEPSDQELKEFRQKGTAFTGNIVISATLTVEQEDKDKIQEYWKTKLGKRSTLLIGDSFTYKYEFSYSKHNYQRTSRTATINLQTKNSASRLSTSDNAGWQKIVQFIRTDIVPEILYYDDFILQIPNEVVFTSQQKKLSNSEKYTDDWMLAINDILKSVDKRFDFQEDIVDIWQKDEDAAINRIALMESALNAKITNRWGELFGNDRINFKEIKLETKYNENKLSISFKIKTSTNRVFNVNERSKGFKWFFSFLLFTEFRKLRTKNILFLLDEPASNLHPTAQAHILDAIYELSSNSLVVYSTHSHHLINPAWLSGAFICINENQSKEVLAGAMDISESAKISAISYYAFVGQGQGNDKTSYFQPILDSLDYQPSFLEPIPDIIILEGKNDWYTFTYFFNQI